MYSFWLCILEKEKTVFGCLCGVNGKVNGDKQILQFYRSQGMEYNQTLVNQARKTRGYLQKKSSGIISIWQKRYFMILDSNLNYYADETLQELKKCIPILDIQEVKTSGDNQFQLVTKKRVYELKTQAEQGRDLWVASLAMLVKFKEKPVLNLPKGRESEDSKKLTYSPPLKTSKLQPKQVSPPSRSPQQKKVKLQPEFSCQNFFRQIGLSKIADGWELERIQNKVIVVKLPRSCYFILSCKTLLLSHRDEDFLQEAMVRPYRLNMLYCYEFGKVESLAVNEICKCSEIEAVQQELKSLAIVVGGKALHLTPDPKKITQTEIRELCKKIQHSIQIGKEYYNSENLKIKRNIDKMLYQYDSKEVTLAEIVKKEIEKCYAQTKENNLKIQFRRTIDNLRRSIKEIFNCCDVLQISRAQFKQKFAREFYHHSMSYLHKALPLLPETLNTAQMTKIIIILHDFWKLVKDFVKDTRVLQTTMSMHTKLMQKYQQELTSKIDSCFALQESQLLQETKIELKGQTQIISQLDTTFFSNSIYRQLHVDIRLVLDQLPDMPVNKQMLQQYLALFRSLFRHIAEQTFKFIDKWKSTDLILGTCNQIEFIKNSLFEQMLSKLTKDYKEMSGFIHEKYIKQIEHEISNTEITFVSNLFVKTFSTIDRNILSKPFYEFDVGLICSEILSRLKQFAKINRYVRRNIFEASFQEICYFYYCNIVKFNRLQAEISHPVDFYTKKIYDDIKSIGQHFQNFIQGEKIYAHLKDLSLIREFIQSDVAQIKRICQLIKKEFGNSFTEEAMTNLLRFRDMNAEIRDNLVLECNEIIKNSVDSIEQISMMSSSKESFLDNWNNSRSRKSTLTLSLNEFYQNQYIAHQNKYSCSVWKQGYLLKKKITKSNSFPEARMFFKINNSRLEEYESQSMPEPSNCHELQYVLRCVLHPEKNYVFLVEFNDYKLKLKADTSDEAKEWIKNIYEEIGTLATIKEPSPEKDRISELNLSEGHRQAKDPSTMQSFKGLKERSPQKSIGSPMLKKKKISSDKQKESSSPERVLKLPKEVPPKSDFAEDSCFKCSKGFFF